MFVSFSCPVCGKKLKADAGSAGRKARCGGCRQAVPIPGAPPLAEDGPQHGAETLMDDEPLVISDAAKEDDVPPRPAPVPSVWSLGSLTSFTTLPETDPATADTSCAVAALYLGAMSFALFLAPAAMGGAMLSLLSPVIAILIYLALVIGSLVFSRLGYRMAKQAHMQARLTGQGLAFAQAGLVVNGFFAAFNVVMALVLLFQLVLVATGKAGVAGGDLGGLLNSLKGLQNQIP